LGEIAIFEKSRIDRVALVLIGTNDTPLRKEPETFLGSLQPGGGFHHNALDARKENPHC
jgi:hypothetical protein